MRFCPAIFSAYRDRLCAWRGRCSTAPMHEPPNRAVAAAACLVLGCGLARMPPSGAGYDLVLSGGRVVDGTGAPWFRADVGIRGDRIAAVGDLSRARARRRLDVRELAVAPGFIEQLGHSELHLLVDNRAESKIRQGITSELTGEGISPAPMNAAWRKQHADWLRRFRLRV